MESSEVIEMCYGSNCTHEKWSGECGKRAHDVCPESFETPEEYEAYVDEYDDLKADHDYEQRRDRELFG